MSLLKKNKIDGLIVLDKPKDFTSNDCLALIKKYLSPNKIGHTGTLDTNATGVLVCLLGSGTKSQDYLMSSGEKIYNAKLILGISTDTEDITGKVISELDLKDKNITKEEIVSAANNFIGDYEQIPPMYSAKKVDGKKLINLARKGKEIERKACKVKIYDIKVNDIEKKGRILEVDINITCSKGTYIRTLCKDIGEKLGVPSCMGDLRRTKTSFFTIDEAITLSDIKEKVNKNDYSFIKLCMYQKSDAVVTFGKFETLHIGHQKIIKEVVDKAKAIGVDSTVLSIGISSDNKILTKEQKISKLKYLGVDNVIDFPFNEYTKNMEPEKFIEDILIKQLKAKVVVVGSDCRYGKAALGEKNLLSKVCKEHNIEVVILDKLKVKDVEKNSEICEKEISSTLINGLYEDNRILADKLLGK